MRTKWLVAGIFLGSFVSGLGSLPAKAADEPKSDAKKKTEPWKPEDFINGEYANQYRFSPDGNWLVWV